jgi:type IV pilus assembly protein PilQ
MKPNRLFHVMLLMVFGLFCTQCATQQAAVQTPPAATAPAAKPAVIQKIAFQEEDRYTQVRVEASEPMELPFYKVLADPLRIAIDIPNADLKMIRDPLRINNGTIAEVVATQYDGKGRIEIGLARMANYNISKEGKVLLIDVEKARTVAEVKPEKKEEAPPKPAENPSPEIKKEEAPPVPVVTSNPAPETMKKAKEVTQVSVEEKPDAVIFTITADGKVGNYNAFKLEGPARLVLDVWSVDGRGVQKSIATKSPLVQKVRLGRYPDKLRFVFDAAATQLPPYGVQPVENKLIVSFGNVPATPNLPASGQEKSQETSGAAKVAGSGKPSAITRIDFKQMDSKSRIAVGTTDEPGLEWRMASKNILVVDLKQASVPRHLQRPLDTSEFASAVDYITIQNVKAGKVNDVRISVKLKEEVPYAVAREGRDVFIDIDTPAKFMAQKAETSSEAQKEESKTEGEALSADESKGASKEEGKAGEGVSPERMYTGRKVSLDFKDADIKNILRLIAEVSNLNIIAGDDVTGKITMRLIEVPWDQALDVVLQSRNLGMSRVGNVIRVAPVDTLKREIQGELEAKRAKEKLEDLVTELVPVNYATGKDIIPQVKTVLSDRGDVKVDERTNILIIKDIPRNVVGAKSLVKSLDTKTPQVLIEARILEANITFQRELGVTWGLQVQSGKNAAGVNTSSVQTTTQGGLPNSAVVDLPAIARSGVAGALGTAGILEFVFNSVHALRQLDIAISAHENNGDVRVISAPKIATLDNKEASIEQGLRIPYLKLTTEGTVTTDFIDANLKLTVIPHVTNEGNIKMNLRVKKDAPDPVITVQGVPSIDKKEAITEVLVRDSGVMVISGIYTIKKTDGVEGLPVFSKIPLLGWLFKREAKEDERKDLLIFISPKIIKDQI